LATFIIGFADSTIIKIFGETPREHSANSTPCIYNVEMNPSCKFVHQNVPDALAVSKELFGRQNSKKNGWDDTSCSKVEQYCIFSRSQLVLMN